MSEKMTLVKHFEDLYKKHLKSKHSFGSFLKQWWGEALRYKEVIEKI